MPDFVRTVWETLRLIDARGALEIGLLTALIYTVLNLLRGTTAMSLLRGGALIVALIYVLAKLLNLDVLDWLLRKSWAPLLAAVPVIFQPELRRTLERVGRARVAPLRNRPSLDRLIEAIVGGCNDLARRQYGALMVIERETGLEDVIATGQRIDAVVSAQLLANIFFRNSPLHDGAVVIRGDRLIAAGCTLPLTEAAFEGHLGTRHRAGIGITERTDAIAVIVSEETSDVSISSNGRLASKLDEAGLRSLLTTLLRQGGGGGPRRPRRSITWPRLSRQPQPEIGSVVAE